MEGLKGKTVLLVTHQVDFLPAFDSVLVISFILKHQLWHCGRFKTKLWLFKFFYLFLVDVRRGNLTSWSI
jgi:hypothetical protein